LPIDDDAAAACRNDKYKNRAEASLPLSLAEMTPGG
jgi:hypothetical protein